MARVLLGWEMGSGFGHVVSLLAIAEALAARGHEPVLVLKDLHGPAQLLAKVTFPRLQAPIWLGRPDPSFTASSYTDILKMRGFTDAESLLVRVEAWHRLIELTGADLVVCDHSPTLALAAYQTLPAVMIGNDFTLPAIEGDAFPTLGISAQPQASARDMLAVIADVQVRRHRPVPSSLAALFTDARRFVCTIPPMVTQK